MLVAVKLPRNEMVAPAVESETVTDVALTVLLKVTPEVLSVIVNASRVPNGQSSRQISHGGQNDCSTRRTAGI